jgi:hypothetical protein
MALRLSRTFPQGLALTVRRHSNLISRQAEKNEGEAAAISCGEARSCQSWGPEGRKGKDKGMEVKSVAY